MRPPWFAVLALPKEQADKITDGIHFVFEKSFVSLVALLGTVTGFYYGGKLK